MYSVVGMTTFFLLVGGVVRLLAGQAPPVACSLLLLLLVGSDLRASAWAQTWSTAMFEKNSLYGGDSPRGDFHFSRPSPLFLPLRTNALEAIVPHKNDFPAPGLNRGHFGMCCLFPFSTWNRSLCVSKFLVVFSILLHAVPYSSLACRVFGLICWVSWKRGRADHRYEMWGVANQLSRRPQYSSVLPFMKGMHYAYIPPSTLCMGCCFAANVGCTAGSPLEERSGRFERGAAPGGMRAQVSARGAPKRASRPKSHRKNCFFCRVLITKPKTCDIKKN